MQTKINDYNYRITRLTVVPEGKPLYDDMATHVTIVDEGAGEYLEIHQSSGCEPGIIKITKEEWSAIQCAIADAMARICD